MTNGSGVRVRGGEGFTPLPPQRGRGRGRGFPGFSSSVASGTPRARFVTRSAAPPEEVVLNGGRSGWRLWRLRGASRSYFRDATLDHPS